MKIEEGKFYKTRDGRKVGPMRENSTFDNFSIAFIEIIGDGRGWSDDGAPIGSKNNISDDDLIAEWTDEPRPWGEMTDAEKVALVEAYRDGQQIELRHGRGDWLENDDPEWAHTCTYRIKPPEPAIETREGTCRAYIYKHSAPFLCDTKVPGTVEGKWTAEVKDGVPQKITWELSNV